MVLTMGSVGRMQPAFYFCAALEIISINHEILSYSKFCSFFALFLYWNFSIYLLETY
jgi:hypothetical protein